MLPDSHQTEYVEQIDRKALEAGRTSYGPLEWSRRLENRFGGSGKRKARTGVW